jgi:ethanolamine ammonia-lyase small subunit
MNPPAGPEGEDRSAPLEGTPMAEPTRPVVTAAPWSALRRHTDARIALGRAGHSAPTAAHLALQQAHASARDAVHLPFDADGVAAGLQALGLPTLLLHSAAGDRATYLQRPDLGRRLDEPSLQALAAWRTGLGADDAVAGFDLAIAIADGLSALAVHQTAVALVAALRARLQADPARWRLAPMVVVEQGRVAVGDHVGVGLGARCVVVLIGERPGLSSPDSLGIYLTWAPRPGLTDAARNCISNVRPAGLAADLAAARLHALLSAARQRSCSGVDLKDESDDGAPRRIDSTAAGFLLPSG